MRLGAVVVNPLFVALAYPLLLLVVLGFAAGRRGLLDDPAAHLPLLRRIAVGDLRAARGLSSFQRKNNAKHDLRCMTGGVGN
jgi:hypothetical protein